MYGAKTSGIRMEERLKLEVLYGVCAEWIDRGTGK